jgi:hypothetical protein
MSLNCSERIDNLRSKYEIRKLVFLIRIGVAKLHKSFVSDHSGKIMWITIANMLTYLCHSTVDSILCRDIQYIFVGMCLI